VTKPNSTHITLIADRTGSMQNIRTDAEGAINQFLDDQRKLPDECSLLLVDFDDVDPFRIVFDGSIQDSTAYTLVPRGNTPLLDATGKGIVTTGERLAALAEEERPSTVIFVVQTDGIENASREYTAEQVREMIKEQTEQWNWTFVFLATGPDAWASGQRMFAGTQMASNAMRSASSGASYAGTTHYMSETVANVRGGGVAAAAAAWSADIDDEGNVTVDEDQHTPGTPRPLP
jgi:hypothetical protein